MARSEHGAKSRLTAPARTTRASPVAASTARRAPVGSAMRTPGLASRPLWQIASQALPLFSILVGQLLTIGLLAYFVSFRLMGRDYESAVMASGFIGFAMGTTANAVANMRALVTRFGAAPRAFLVIPLVGAFFIDFANALIVTAFVNGVK